MRPAHAPESNAGVGHPFQGAPQDTHQSALAFYFSILRRRKAAASVCVLIPFALALIYTFLQDPLYQGTARVLLNRQNLANALTGTPDPSAQANDFIRIVQTQASVARSPDVARQTLDREGSELTPEALLRQSSVEPARDADLLNFHVWSENPREAIGLTNSYAKEFTNYRVAIDTASLRQAQDEVADRVRLLDARGMSDSRLAASLQSKAQELDTLEALQTSNATVIATASEAVQIAPRKLRNALLGLIVGIVFATLVIVALETFDTRARSEKEIEDRLGLMPLARISAPASNLDGQLLMLVRPNSPEADAFRLLRTNLQFASLSEPVKSLLMTSSVQGEGKSTTMSNLAVAMARSGDHVILVDLDLRRPTIRRLFKLGARPGLTDVAVGNVSLDEALEFIDLGLPTRHEQSGQAGSLAILGAGTPPPNPGEFIGSPASTEIVRQLQDRCDVVLIDAPPALLLGDALVLSRLADAVLLCVRLPGVTRSMLDELRRSLANAHARTLGFVTTGNGEIHAGYGYGYGYRYEHVPEDAPPARLAETEREAAAR